MPPFSDHSWREHLWRGLQLFLLLFAVAVLVQLLGQSGAHLATLIWPGAGGAAVAAFLAELWVAAICVLAVFWLAHKHPRPSLTVTVASALFTVVGIVATNTLLNTVQDWTAHLLGNANDWRNPVYWLLLFLACALMWAFVALKLLPRVQQWFQMAVDRHSGDEAHYPGGPVAIVMLVSPIPEGSLAFSEAGNGVTVTIAGGRQPASTGSMTLLCDDIVADAQKLDGLKPAQWPWQQIMRGISKAVVRTGSSDTTRIVLVGSSGPSGSFRLLELCRKFLQRYPGIRDYKRVFIETSVEFLAGTAAGTAGIDFEDFNAVKEHVYQVLNKASEHLSSDHIFVDVTGGQKTTSIAAAVATIGMGRCQYVQTKPPNDVLFYDLHPPAQFSW